MLRERAGNAVKGSQRVNGQSPELRQQYEALSEVQQTIHASALNKFTFARVDSWWRDLNAVLYQLEQLPYPAFVEMMSVIDLLREARNELRLARFLFDLAEVNQVYRLILRNRAVLRGEKMLEKLLRVWPGPGERIG